MSAHIQGEQRRRRLNAATNLIVLSKELQYHPDNPLYRGLFRDAVREAFVNAFNPREIAKLAGWSEQAVREELNIG